MFRSKGLRTKRTYEESAHATRSGALPGLIVKGLSPFGHILRAETRGQRVNMSQWDQRFEGHQALVLLREFAELVGRIQPESPEVMEAWARLQKVGSFVLSAASQVDAELVTPLMLDGIMSPMTNAVAEIRAYLGDSAATRLETANTYADQILDEIGRWPYPRTAEDLDGLRERATSFRASVGQLLRHIGAEAEAVKGQVEGLTTTLDEIRSEAGTATSSIQQQALEKVEEASARVVELGATVDAQKARLDAAIATYQQQFSDAEAARAQRFEASAKEQQTNVAAVLATLKDEAEATQAGLAEQAEDALADLRKQAEEAKTLAVALGAIGVSGGHGQYAKEQKTSADFWRWVSVFALVGLVVLAAGVLLTLPETGIQWERFVAKLLISGPLIALAGYAANQSGKHRRAERESRKVDLDLAALELYLALFPPEKRDEIKEQIGLRVFGQPLAPDAKDGERIGAGQLWDFIKQVVPPK